MLGHFLGGLMPLAFLAFSKMGVLGTLIHVLANLAATTWA